MIILSRGELYPLSFPAEGACARALFLTDSGSILQIALPGMDSQEQNALRSGMLKAGFCMNAE
jgi:hypothetical protein